MNNIMYPLCVGMCGKLNLMATQFSIIMKHLCLFQLFSCHIQSKAVVCTVGILSYMYSCLTGGLDLQLYLSSLFVLFSHIETKSGIMIFFVILYSFALSFPSQQ